MRMTWRGAQHDRTRVAFPFVGSLVGGSHFSSLGLIKHLDPAKFEPLVIVDEIENPVARLFVDLDMPLMATPRAVALPHGRPISAGKVISVGLAIPRLTRFLRREGIGLVHVNDGRTAAVWAVPARLAGAKLVWHHRSGPRAMGLRFASPVLANAIIAVSDFACGQARRARRRTWVIHSPFDTKISIDRGRMRDALLRELGCDRSARIVGFFGALIPRKRPLLFVEALAALGRRHPDLPVIGAVFGESVDIQAGELLDLAGRLGVRDKIHIMGFRAPGAAWIGACDVLAVPAVDEPFGRTLIEAMIVGTPVVATRSGGNADALDNGRLGRLASPDDPDALAAAIGNALINQEHTAAMTEAARVAVQARFGEERHAQRVMIVYDKLLRTVDHDAGSRKAGT